MNVNSASLKTRNTYLKVAAAYKQLQTYVSVAVFSKLLTCDNTLPPFFERQSAVRVSITCLEKTP